MRDDLKQLSVVLYKAGAQAFVPVCQGVERRFQQSAVQNASNLEAHRHVECRVAWKKFLQIEERLLSR